MSLNLKLSVFRALRFYKKLDIRFRRNSSYEYFSFYFFNIFRQCIGLRKINFQKIVCHHYLKNFDVLDLEEGSLFFDSFWGKKISGDPLAIYREFRSRDRSARVYWVTRPGTYIPEDVEKDKFAIQVNYNSKKYAESLIKAEVIVFNMNLPYYFVRKAGQVLVNTWHGIPIKKLGLDIDQPVSLSANTQRCFNISNILTVASDYEYDKVVRACGAGRVANHRLSFGSPRIDLMLNADGKQVRKRLGLDLSKRVVLFAPTWRGSAVSVSSQVDDQISAIEKLESELGEEYQVLVSLHHFTLDAVNHKRLGINILPEGVDINEALKSVDILISDYSSIVIDFLLLNRPVVLYVPDLQEYSVERGLYLGLDDLPCSVVRTKDELVNSVIEGITPSEFENYSNYLRFLVPHEDGLAAKRLVDNIDSIDDFCADLESPSDNKILIFPGALRDNGITSSLRSLVESLGGDGFKLYIIVDARHQRLVSSFYKHFNYFRERCEIILVDRAFSRFDEVSEVYQKYLTSPFSLTEEEELVLDNVVKREVSRVLGDVEFKAAIDFSGYDQYWSLFISGVNAERKIIYLHSDMKAEADNPKRKHRYLRNIFSIYKRFDFVVSVSEAIRMVNEENLKTVLKECRSVSVPNVLDLNGMVKKSRVPVGFLVPEIMSIGSGITKFVCLSRLSPEKNIKLAIDSFERVCERYDAVLVIVGEGVSADELKKHANSKSSSSRIKFTGHLDNPYPVLKSSDCLLFPSSYEGQGLALLEAMTLGTFCIASDIPAARDVLEGTGCFVVNPDIESFSQAMIDFIEAKPDSINFNSKLYNQHALSRFKGLILESGA